MLDANSTAAMSSPLSFACRRKLRNAAIIVFPVAIFIGVLTWTVLLLPGDINGEEEGEAEKSEGRQKDDQSNTFWRREERDEERESFLLGKTFETYTSSSKNLDVFYSSYAVFNSSSVQWPLVVFSTDGRIGNCLNSYATALSFAWLQNSTDVDKNNVIDFHFVLRKDVTFAITQKMYEIITHTLDPRFLTLPIVGNDLLKVAEVDGLSDMPVTPDYETNDMTSRLQPAIEKAAEDYRSSHKKVLTVLKGYPNRMGMFAHHHQILRQNFRIHNKLLKKAASFLEKIRSSRKRKDDITFVGFHIRRGDYVHFMKTFFGCPVPGDAYYEAALDYYRQRYKNPVFVVCSNNIVQAKQRLSKFPDVVFSEFSTGAEDMALLASCSHSITTMGSFSFWGAFFAGGNVVYPLVRNCTKFTPELHPKHLELGGYENWFPIDA